MPYKYNAIEGVFDLVMSPGSGTATTEFDTDSGTATPTSGGVITLSGGNLISTSGSGSTVTFDAATTIPVSILTNSGTAIPSANAMSILGSGDTTVSGSGSTVTISTNVVVTHSPKQYSFTAEGLSALETNFGVMVQLTGTFVKILVRAFDDTTEEYANGKFFVPSDFDTSSTITFRAYVAAATAAAAKNIGLTFGHRAVNNAEAWDQSYTDVDSTATSINSTQGFLTLVTWTVANSTAGWAANDLIEFRISRDTSVTSNLTGDMYLFQFEVSLPRT